METLKWGILGTARISAKVIEGMRYSRHSTFFGVASRDPSTAEIFARQWKIPKSYSCYEAMLADPMVDVVYIPLPNHMHAEWTIKALAAGKHVLCEKPLALSVGEIEQIINTSKERQLVVAEAFMYRHLKQTIRIEQIIADGEIGSVRFIRGSFSFMLTRPEDVRLSPKYGGGCLWDIGCYPVSYARVMIGQMPNEVEGHKQVGHSGVDEFFIGQMSFPNGALTQFDCSFRLPSYTNMEIRGEKGSLIIPTPFNPDTRSTVILRKQKSEKKFPFNSKHLYLGEIEDMNSAILDGKPPLISLEDSLQNVQTLLALHESASRKMPVHLDAKRE